MKNVILIIFLIGTAIIAEAQVLVVNPQNNTGEGGEILLLKSNSTFNDWRIDNYRGYFRLHHSGKSYLNLNKNGNLSLNGKIETKEIKVTNTPTADFVFEESYKLPSLDFIENYIKSKKHLPEIASAEKMKQDGVNIGDFQIQLLQKIEELTLYTIQQEKRIKTLESNNQSLRKENKQLHSLSERLNEIEKLLKTNE